MPLPAALNTFLLAQSAQYDTLAYDPDLTPMLAARALNIEPGHLLRVAVLQDEQGPLLALLPAPHMLSFELLMQNTGRDVDTLDAFKALSLFKDCKAGTRPALPAAFELIGIRSQSSLTIDPVYIESGTGDSLLRFTQAEFSRLSGLMQIADFSQAMEPEPRQPPELLTDVVLTHFLPLRMKQRVRETYDLPAMPEIAQEIMRLRVDPNASARDLANIVNRDPSLAAQVMSWANSPYYGFSGRIQSVEQAIMRVLGFELVLNLALGISVGRSLRVQVDGPLGLRAFWVQAVLSATLAERLCVRLKLEQRPQRGLVYLSGLLHNIGYLFLGHIFPPQFHLVNRYVSASPDIPVDQIEQHVIGVMHTEIGSWLMEAWNMPEEIVCATRWHHDALATGPYIEYAQLVMLADRLLRRLAIGDAGTPELPQNVLVNLGLQPVDIEDELSRINESRRELEDMASRMVA